MAASTITVQQLFLGSTMMQIPAVYCSDCFFEGSASSETYNPKGTFGSICNTPVYTSKSLSDVTKGSLLFLPDGFGLAKHNIVLADEYARNGYDVFVIDYFEGDALPVIFMSYTPGTDLESYTNLTINEKKTIQELDMPSWLQKHNSSHIWSILLPTIRQLHTDLSPSSKLYVLGHCFGGKYAIALAKRSIITAAVAFHPSFMEPDDLQDLKQPLFIGCAETDVFTPNLITELLVGLQRSGTRYELSVYGGTKHGFASRADMSEPIAASNLKRSFENSIVWLARQ